MESCVVYEGEDVRFECRVSHEEAPLAQWKLQDVPLQNNEMNLIKSEGRVHSLTLRGVTTADSGIVTFSVGNHTSTASLTVRGKKMHFMSWDENSHFAFMITFGLLLIYLNYLPCRTPSLYLSKELTKNLDACDVLRLFYFNFIFSLYRLLIYSSIALLYLKSALYCIFRHTYIHILFSSIELELTFPIYF